MADQPARGSSTRRALLDALQRAIANDGISRKSIPQIANDANVSVSRFTNYFGRKNIAIHAAYEDAWEQMFHRLGDVDPALAPKDQLRRDVAALFTLYEEAPHVVGTVLGRLHLDPEFSSDTIGYRALVVRFAGLFQAAALEGTAPEKCEQAAETIIREIGSGLENHRYRGHLREPDSLYELYVRSFTDEFVAEAPAKSEYL